jgi:ATP phosphoribosyltransferase regulatory subunit HisZ
LAVLNHDDDVLYFELYEQGAKTDEYNSTPSFFDEEVEEAGPSGGNAERLASAFGRGETDKIEAVLRSEEYVFAHERHRELAELLGFPVCSVAVGYTYAAAGDLPPGTTENVYAHTEG